MPKGISVIDIIALIAITFGLIRGLFTGFIKEIAGLLGLIVGVWAGLRLGFVFANYYKANFELPDKIIPAVAFLTAFALALTLVIVAGKLLKFVLEKTALSLFDKVAGALFGTLKMAFLVGTFFSLIGKSGILSEETKTNSLTYGFVTKYAEIAQEYTIGLIPAVKNVFTELDEYFGDLSDSTEETEP